MAVKYTNTVSPDVSRFTEASIAVLGGRQRCHQFRVEATYGGGHCCALNHSNPSGTVELGCHPPCGTTNIRRTCANLLGAVVTQILVSSNQLEGWLRQIEALRAAA
jgi:hypothetical protein